MALTVRELAEQLNIIMLVPENAELPVNLYDVENLDEMELVSVELEYHPDGESWKSVGVTLFGGSA